jgi:DNA-binding XRE family transcriptional regulator
MKKMKNLKTITKYNFTPLNKIIGKKLKNEQFRKSFTEETSRLQLAQEIKTLRQKRKMTQKEVAVKADMPQSVVARIESGTHSFSVTTLSKIATAFNKKIGFVEHAQNRR